MTWTSLSFAYGSVLTSAKMTQMYDNFAAMAVGASGAPAITGFVDNDNGAVAIGMMMTGYNNSGASVASGATVAGSSLTPVGGTIGTNVMSGTWRNIGSFAAADYPTAPYTSTWQRIS